MLAFEYKNNRFPFITAFLQTVRARTANRPDGDNLVSRLDISATIRH
jgi:hypothetical protein